MEAGSCVEHAHTDAITGSCHCQHDFTLRCILCYVLLLLLLTDECSILVDLRASVALLSLLSGTSHRQQ